MNKSLILNEIIDKIFNGSKSDFARKLDVKPQTISTWLARNTFDIDLVFAKCEGLSAEWLLTGKGAMFKSDTPHKDTSNDILTLANGVLNTLMTPLLDRIETQTKEIARLETELRKYRPDGSGQ